MKIPPQVQKHWPWIVGGGVVLGIVWLYAGDSGDDSGEPGYSSNYDPAVFGASLEQQALMADIGIKQAMAQGQINAQMAQANAMQTAAQAQIIAAQGAQAQQIGETYGKILSVVSQPQLMAMQEAGKATTATIQAAAATQLANLGGLAEMVSSFTQSVGGLGAVTAHQVGGATSAAIKAPSTNLGTIAGLAGSFFNNAFGAGQLGGLANLTGGAVTGPIMSA